MRVPCSGRLELVSAVPPKRHHGRWPLSAAGRGAHFRLRPGQRHRFRVGLPAALLKQSAHGKRVRVLAVSIPDPGGGGALARVMVLSR